MEEKEKMDASKLTERELQDYRLGIFSRMDVLKRCYEHYHWLDVLLRSPSIADSVMLKIPDTDKVVPFSELFLIGLDGVTPDDDRYAAKREVEKLLKAHIEASIKSLELLLIDSLFAHEHVVV
jgi:hypothetical protein